MPRKPKIENEVAPQEQPTVETTEPTTERKGRRSRTKVNPTPELLPPATVAPSVESAPPPAPSGIVERAQKRLSRRKKPEEQPVLVESAPEPVVAAAPEPKKRGLFRRRTPKETETAAAVVEAPPVARDDFSSGEPDLPIPSWRPRKAAGTAREKAAVAGQATEQTSGRRPRNRNTRKERPEPPVAVQAEAAPEEVKPTRGRRPAARAPELKPAPPVPEPLPVKPARPTITIPDDAPQVVLRDGIPTLVRDHRVYPPMAFFGSSPDAERAATVLDEMRLAGEAGIHIHSHLIEFEVDPRSIESSISFAAYMLNKSIQADPEAQVIFRIVFIAPAGWPDRFPDARYETADGMLAEPSVADDTFWDVAKDCLRTFIQSLRMLESRDHILGVHLERGEWFFAQGWGYDTSAAARQRFRDWARTRYGNDIVALRAAWFDGTVNFVSLNIPEYKYETSAHEKFIRSSRRERRWVDYHLFLSDATVERIGDLAYTAKEASEGYFLVGASYGYTFEWSHPASGHLSLGKLLRAPEIDFIAGPPSYQTRQPGGAAPFPGPIDSFALNGKLYISEEDFKTSIGGRQEPDDFNPVIKTPQALESVHWRGAGSALAHASGVCWMDLWGNGWLKTPGIWKRAADVREDLIRRMAAPLQDPDVAVFIDERALAYLVDEEAFALLVQNVRESVLRSGLSAAFYLLSDLQHREKFPESKLYVFLNAWDVRPDLRAAIKNRLQKDNKVLFWIFAAGMFDSGRESLERAREITGIALKPQPFNSKTGTTVLNRRHPLCEAFSEKGIGGGARMEPSYFAIPEEATVLGEYTHTGLPSFVVKEFNQGPVADHWKSVFLGEPVVTPALLRALGHMAGVHVWNYQEDVVHVRPPFLTVHCTGAGPRTLTLPNKWSCYNLVTNDWVPSDSSSVRFSAIDGSTHLFMAGPKEELDQILSIDPESMLHIDVLPEKPDNTVRFDAATFDVPIMKLDEWIDGGENDDISEDFMFRPQLIEEQSTEAERSTGRRRRRRRPDSEDTGRRYDGPKTAFEDSDVGMNVVFRQRK